MSHRKWRETKLRFSPFSCATSCLVALYALRDRLGLVWPILIVFTPLFSLSFLPFRPEPYFTHCEQDDLFTWQQVSPNLDESAVLSAVLVLLNVTGHGLTCDDYEKPVCDLDGQGDDSFGGGGGVTTTSSNYPDLVPIEERGAEAVSSSSSSSVLPASSTLVSVSSTSPTGTSGPRRSTTAQDMESAFLIMVLLSTIIFLYLFPADAAELSGPDSLSE